MKKIILISIILFISGSVFASADVDLSFKQANDSFKKGDYNVAINSYRDIIERGVRNASVYYNLGNAYYKANEIGKAVLSYKRALRLSPRDKDIKNNLKYVLVFIKEEEVNTPFEKLVDGLFNMVTLNKLTLFVHFTYILLFIMLAVYLFIKNRPLFWINISLGIIFTVSGIWLCGRIYSQEILKKAIVINAQGEVHNGPGDEYSVAFTVPEGKEVIVIQEKNLWYEVGVRDQGIKGWIKKEEIEKI